MVMQGTGGGGNPYIPIAASSQGGFSWANMLGGAQDWFNTPQSWMAMAALSEAFLPNNEYTAAPNAFARQQAQTKSAMNMMQQLLAGNEKVTIDAEQGTFSAKGKLENIETALGGGGEQPLANNIPSQRNLAGPSMPPSNPRSNTVNRSHPAQRMDAFSEYDLRANPSSSPLGDLRLSDLAGLTPQEMMGIFQLKIATDRLEREDVVRRQNADTARMNSIISGSRLAYDLSQKDKTAAIKNYEYALGQGYNKSFDEFQKDARTTHQKDYKEAKEGGYTGSFHEWMLELARTGAAQFNFGETKERAKAGTEGRADASRKAYFHDPKGLDKDVEDYISSEAVQNQLFPYISDANAYGEKKTRLAEGFIDSKIIAAGGKIIDKKLDGRTFVWTVTWLDGTTSEVRHAN